MKKNDDYLMPAEVAELLLVSPVTVRQWARKGLLKAEITPGGHRRFSRGEVERFAREQNKGNIPLGPYKILVVDDSRPFTEYVVKLLSKLPYEIETSIAYDGFDAGKQLALFSPDLVIMDLKMPGMDGHTVCKNLKSEPRTNRVRVIAMTGYYTADSARRIMAAGAEACLSKPFDNKVLLELVGLKNPLLS